MNESDEITPQKIKWQRVHGVSVRWRSDWDGPYPTWKIECPYSAEDHDKPCRIWADGIDSDNGVYEDGCWVQQSYDAAGWEGVTLTIPDGSIGPWLVYVTGRGDDGPHLFDISMCEVEP